MIWERKRFCTKYIILARNFQSIVILFTKCTADMFLMAYSLDFYFFKLYMNNNELLREPRCLQYLREPIVILNKQFQILKCISTILYNSEFENDNIIIWYRKRHSYCILKREIIIRKITLNVYEYKT